jgi:cell division GTPase FtsZ
MFEGAQRKAIADDAHELLSECIDTMITIPNDRILQIIDRKTSLLDAFEIADDVLRQGVQGISELITVPGLINVDFADVRAIMSNKGSALMGIGRGHGDNRASDAAKAAIASPLLEVSIDGAKGILFTITGGSNLGMYEVSEAAKVITQSADPSAKVIFGAIIDETMKDEVKVTVIATGFETRSERPKVKSILSSGTYVPPRPPESLERLPFTSRATPIAKQPEPGATTMQPSRPTEHAELSRPVEPPPSMVQPHVQAPSYSPIQTNRPPMPPPSRVSPKGGEDEDLEIPAFIRKKMM